MWLSILENLNEVLQKKGELADVAVQFGGEGCQTYPCVQLLRGNMTDLARQRQVSSGTYTFYVDLWVQNDDPNPKAGYVELNKLERIVIPVIEKWLSDLRFMPCLAVKAEISEIKGGEEKLRPLLTSRCTVKLQFRQENQE